MGISNSIGSNTFDILLCLGLPWLIKSSFSPTQPGKHYISINSGGLEYSAISLLSTLLLLYIAFASNKFQLDQKVGRACLCMYAVFLILASLIELNVFFRVNLPTCQRTVKWSLTWLALPVLLIVPTIVSCPTFYRKLSNIIHPIPSCTDDAWRRSGFRKNTEQGCGIFYFY